MRTFFLLLLSVLVLGSLFAESCLSEYDYKGTKRLSTEANFAVGVNLANLGRQGISLNDYYRRKDGKTPELCVSFELNIGVGSYILPYMAVGMESGLTLYMDRQKFGSPKDMLTLGGPWSYITPQWLENKNVCLDMYSCLNYTELGVPLYVYVKLAPFYRKENWLSLTGLLGVNFVQIINSASYHEEFLTLRPYLKSDTDYSFLPFLRAGLRLHLGLIGFSYFYGFPITIAEHEDSYYKARAHSLSISFLYTLAV